MARLSMTGVSISRTVKVVGRRLEGEDGRVAMVVEVDGRVQATHHDEATHQEAIYVATQKAMRRAHVDGVTDLVIDSDNNIVEGHIVKGWKRREPRLEPFQQAIEGLLPEFDKVDWR